MSFFANRIRIEKEGLALEIGNRYIDGRYIDVKSLIGVGSSDVSGFSPYLRIANHDSHIYPPKIYADFRYHRIKIFTYTPNKQLHLYEQGIDLNGSRIK